ncbi:MAG: PA2779 family protein [Pseudohongiellaceae bacterium]
MSRSKPDAPFDDWRFLKSPKLESSETESPTMNMTKRLRTPTIFSLIFSLLLLGVQAPAMADVVGTKELTMQAELQLQRNDVRELLAREDVRTALLDYGVSAADVDNRIDNLTSSELLQIQNQLTDLPAGGVLGVIVGLILIFVLLDLLGATDVFPRI